MISINFNEKILKVNQAELELQCQYADVEPFALGRNLIWVMTTLGGSQFQLLDLESWFKDKTGESEVPELIQLEDSTNILQHTLRLINGNRDLVTLMTPGEQNLEKIVVLRISRQEGKPKLTPIFEFYPERIVSKSIQEDPLLSKQISEGEPGYVDIKEIQTYKDIILMRAEISMKICIFAFKVVQQEQDKTFLLSYSISPNEPNMEMHPTTFLETESSGLPCHLRITDKGEMVVHVLLKNKLKVSRCQLKGFIDYSSKNTVLLSLGKSLNRFTAVFEDPGWHSVRYVNGTITV